MEPVDIRTGGGDYLMPMEVGAGQKEPKHGKEMHLYDETLKKLDLDPMKIKVGDEFTGQIKFKIESLAANCVGIEITHMGVEGEKKEKDYMSSR